LSTIAPRFDLYEEAVNGAVSEVLFMTKTYLEHRGREPLTLREDFCGTALEAACFVTYGRNPENRRAIAVDLCAEELEHARKITLGRLSDSAAGRIRFVQADVLESTEGCPGSPRESGTGAGLSAGLDLVSAKNYSFNIFKTRPLLCAYFAKVLASLNPSEGMFVLDLYGGWESVHSQVDEPRPYDIDAPEEVWDHPDVETRIEPYTKKVSHKIKYEYLWEQASYNPITSETLCHIHFYFPADGSWMRNAFTYDWRLWSIPELRELLAEAGFGSTKCYYSEFDDEGELIGEYEAREEATSCCAFAGYIVALP
jgi:hypothetical protein